MRSIIITLAMLATASFIQAQNWNETFEGGIGDWDVSNGTWEVGVPTSGPGSAHKGTQCAATILAGNYPGPASSRLISPEITVPAAVNNPRLRFWHWYSFAFNDLGIVQIKEKGTSDWVSVSADYINTGSGIWTRPSIDLTNYAGKTIQLAFFIAAAGTYGVSSGWYIDDIEIVTGPITFNNPEGWENGMGDWHPENGAWEVGEPLSGPNAAYKGTNCAATVLNGNYPEPCASRFISPAFIVPDSAENPKLRFWHWYSFAFNDFGIVQIKETDTSVWEPISTVFENTGGGIWTRSSLDLLKYAGKTVQLAFYIAAAGTYGVSSGWYIDEIEIVNRPTVVLIKDTSVCEGSRIVLTAYGSGGAKPYSYKWSNNSTGRDLSLIIDRDTAISVILTDANGWTSSDTINIKTLESPVFSIMPNDTLDNISPNKGLFTLVSEKFYTYDINPKVDSAKTTPDGLNIYVTFTDAYKVYTIEATHQITACKALKSVLLNNVTTGTPVTKKTKSRVFPNPVSENSACRVQLPERGMYLLEITGISGKKLYRKNISTTGNESFRLDLSGLPAGTYLLTIHGKKTTETLKLLIIK